MSENCERLRLDIRPTDSLSELCDAADSRCPNVSLLRLPARRNEADAAKSESAFLQLATYCERLHPDSVVCILTSPPDAARLLPYLEASLVFQLWVAVRLSFDSALNGGEAIPEHHAALLVLSRYQGTLRHTKTRVQYSYCPACGKTTKDYGGKKHIYHEYGTLLSDVWRDIQCDPIDDIQPITDRLRDLFGLPPYVSLQVVDLRRCTELSPERKAGKTRESKLPFTWGHRELPVDSRLINDDCLKALADIPDGSIDFCFADPPYNIQKKYDHWNDALESIEYFNWCDRWLSELARVVKPGRTLAVINIPLWAVRHYQFLSRILQFQSWIVWEGLGLPVRMIMPAHYGIICFSKGEPRALPGREIGERGAQDSEALSPLAETYCLRSSCVTQRRKRQCEDRAEIGDLWCDIHRLKHNSRRVDHPCQLPPLLMRRLFALFTRPGERILDCFNGAGTSTLVAQQMNRSFIGIEQSSQYHELALQRHHQLSNGEDPFGKKEGVPSAKNSRVERLPKRKYVVSKKVLQLDVKRITNMLGRLPSREDVIANSKYPIEYFDEYFISWGEVCAAARTTGMSEMPREGVPPVGQLQLMQE